MSPVEDSRRGVAVAEMDMLRAEVRAVGRRLTREQMLELAEILEEMAGGASPEARSWRLEEASPR